MASPLISTCTLHLLNHTLFIESHQFSSLIKMSPKPFHPKIEPNNGLYDSPSPLKINKESYNIKKSSSPPSSSHASCLAPVSTEKPQHRPPVIIYTHSPRIIHTHPRDFMALVQKLTGYTPNEEDPPPQFKVNNNGSPDRNDTSGNNKGINNNEDNESMNSVVTDENGSCLSDPPVNSCFMPPHIFDHHSNPGFNNIPFFAPTSDFLCSTPPTMAASSSFCNYVDPLYFMPRNIRRSMSSSASLEGLKDYPDM